jgi:NMD protein affecting ribosome stability and mRNA decay
MIRETMTRCESCGRETRTVRGLCPNCGHIKEPGFEPPSRYLRSGGPGVLDDDA